MVYIIICGIIHKKMKDNFIKVPVMEHDGSVIYTYINMNYISTIRASYDGKYSILYKAKMYSDVNEEWFKCKYTMEDWSKILK